MITLSSDFGWPYPAAMRGVIAAQSDARLIDVTHDFPRGDVRTAAFWMRELLPWFPPAVHLVVVDPGVGTDRAVLVMEADGHVLVGPDNGVLRPAARALAAEVDTYVREPVDARSATFHGRDVFAPLAAAVHEHDGSLADLPMLDPGTPAVDLRLPRPTIDGDVAAGEVLVVDGFGNAITNVPGTFIAGYNRARVAGRTVPIARTYAAVEPGAPLVTIGSHENVELAVNDGRGAAAFGVAPGDAIRVERLG